MKRSEKADIVYKILNRIYKKVPIPLKHQNKFELVVAVLLSAQCTDERVNQVTPILFKKANTAKKMIKIPKKISEKKDFISGRIIEVEKQLIKAEENLKIFRESNRSIFQSPSLMLEQERLVREVSTLMQLYLTLKSQYELVQIELFDGSNGFLKISIQDDLQ